MLNCPNEVKAILRKTKLSSKATDAARAKLKSGLITSGLSGAYIQFGIDVQTYGLWEALLYAEGYEGTDCAKGTAQIALDAAITKIPKSKAPKGWDKVDTSTE